MNLFSHWPRGLGGLGGLETLGAWMPGDLGSLDAWRPWRPGGRRPWRPWRPWGPGGLEAWRLGGLEAWRPGGLGGLEAFWLCRRPGGLGGLGGVKTLEAWRPWRPGGVSGNLFGNLSRNVFGNCRKMRLNVGTEREQMFCGFESESFAETKGDKLMKFASGQSLLPSLPLVKFKCKTRVPPLTLEGKDSSFKSLDWWPIKV